MSRVIAFVTVALLIALAPLAASAHEEELAALKEKGDALAGETAEEWEASAAEVETALDALKAADAESEYDYADVDAAVADLKTAIEAGDLELTATEAEAVAAAIAALQAAGAADGEGAADGTPAPTAVNTGSEVTGGPNVLLLGVAGLFALLAIGALVLRRGPGTAANL